MRQSTEALPGGQAITAMCVDLKAIFGDHLKLDVDKSYYAERPEFRRQEEPWLTHVLCQKGHIGVWGNNLLVACTNRAGSVAKRLKALPFVTVVQDGTDGVNATFPPDHFDAVAEIMKPRKRRRLSGEQRAKLVEAGAKYRFQHGAQSDSEASVCVGSPCPV